MESWNRFFFVECVNIWKFLQRPNGHTIDTNGIRQHSIRQVKIKLDSGRNSVELPVYFIWMDNWIFTNFFSHLRMHFASQFISFFFQYLYIISASAFKFGACYVGYFAFSNYMISWNTMHTVAAIADWISIASYIRPTMLHYDQCNEIIKTIIFSFFLSFLLTFVASFFFSLNRLWEKVRHFFAIFSRFHGNLHLTWLNTHFPTDICTSQEGNETTIITFCRYMVYNLALNAITNTRIVSVSISFTISISM